MAGATTTRPKEVRPTRTRWKVNTPRPLAAAPVMGSHGPELQDLELPAALPDPALPIEQRPRVPDAVGDPHDGNGRGQDDQTGQRHHEVDDPLHAPVAGTVELADVEHQRDALQLRDRQLAQPLVVEQG